MNRDQIGRWETLSILNLTEANKTDYGNVMFTLIRALEQIDPPIPDVQLYHFLTTGAVYHKDGMPQPVTATDHFSSGVM